MWTGSHSIATPTVIDKAIGSRSSGFAQFYRVVDLNTYSSLQVTKWRFKAEKLATDYEKLSGAMGETTLATEWRERYEQLIAQKDALAKEIERLEASSAHPAHALGEVHPVDSRRTNSSSWLPMARTRRLSSGSSTISAFEPPNATTTNEYLKNIVYRYLTTEQLEVDETNCFLINRYWSDCRRKSTWRKQLLLFWISHPASLRRFKYVWRDYTISISIFLLEAEAARMVLVDTLSRSLSDHFISEQVHEISIWYRLKGPASQRSHLVQPFSAVGSLKSQHPDSWSFTIVIQVWLFCRCQSLCHSTYGATFQIDFWWMKTVSGALMR